MKTVSTSARRRLALLATLLIPIGVATKLYTGPGSEWVVGNFGGSVYVAFWCLAVLTLWPRFSAARVAIVVLCCTASLEFLQLWHPAPLEAVRGTLLGQAVLGSYFSWTDFPFYFVGAALAVPLARFAKRSGSAQSPAGPSVG